ncbi:MAG: hypothetical protein HY301_18920 [Verrucomicrobia bacterium]|nr:hypothetical protein [Verrucomicrobiota bacterium]
MDWQLTLLGATAYVLLGRWLVRARWRGRAPAFAVLNLAAVIGLTFQQSNPKFMMLYVALVCGQYVALRWWATRAGWLPWLAFLMPIAALAVVRYVPVGVWAAMSAGLREKIREDSHFNFAAHFVGLSYLAFRTSQLVLEVRNGVVKRPGFWEYLGFAFFAPTLSVGPISPYRQHVRAFGETDRPQIPVGRALLRVLVGAVKFKFFGALLLQLTYSVLLLDGHPHHWVDLPVAVVAYYLYLYCNFSGFCDLAIGGAGLMGIAVAENFDRPFAARNVKDFWNRWHLTLSQYMREVVFSPLSKALVRAFGPTRANHAIALTIVVVFLLVGVWHGVGWNYAAFGAAHALGVVANHYYTIALKKWLGRERFVAYNQSRAIQAAAVALTFCYVAASLFLFANDSTAMKSIFDALTR